jgi:hypothetical protein
MHGSLLFYEFIIKYCIFFQISGADINLITEFVKYKRMLKIVFY